MSKSTRCDGAILYAVILGETESLVECLETSTSRGACAICATHTRGNDVVYCNVHAYSVWGPDMAPDTAV